MSPPDEFFDDEVENDKEFLDIATSIYNGGIENITTVNVNKFHNSQFTVLISILMYFS